MSAEVESGGDRELIFTLEIRTDLGENDEAVPTMRYVGDWLNDNNYAYRQIGTHTITPPVDPSQPGLVLEEPKP